MSASGIAQDSSGMDCQILTQVRFGKMPKPTQLLGITFDAYLTFWLVQVAGRSPEKTTPRHSEAATGLRLCVNAQALNTKVRRSEERRKDDESCRGLTPAAHLVLVRFYGLGRCVQ